MKEDDVKNQLIEKMAMLESENKKINSDIEDFKKRYQENALTIAYIRRLVEVE